MSTLVSPRVNAVSTCSGVSSEADRQELRFGVQRVALSLSLSLGGRCCRFRAEKSWSNRHQAAEHSRDRLLLHHHEKYTDSNRQASPQKGKGNQHVNRWKCSWHLEQLGADGGTRFATCVQVQQHEERMMTHRHEEWPGTAV